jgi:predicted RNase H-related nuclease YkuK (DUF458 family)
MANTNFSFFKTSMPKTRKADFYLGCCDSSVFIDFNKTVDNLIYLCRISFDGYGCCNIKGVNYLSSTLSSQFLAEISKPEIDQDTMAMVVKELIGLNKKEIWADALQTYQLG